ncbi:MAG: S8 family serine peptidase [Bacteroidota bacterium]
MSYRFTRALLALALIASASVAQAQAPRVSAAQLQQVVPAYDRLAAVAQERGVVPVIVRLDVDFLPEGRLFTADVQRQRARLAERRDQVLRTLAANGVTVERVKRFETVPVVALSVTAEGLRFLAASPLVRFVEEDEIVRPTLATSTALVGAPDAWSSGYRGAGQAVAVLDTGVDGSHSFLQGKVVAEACYSGTGGGTSVCPNGQTQQTGPGAGQNCPRGTSGCDHGTHVAGIVAGSGPSFSGVAPDADIIAVQVFTQFTGFFDCFPSPSPCVGAFTSDIISGLEFVYAQRTERNVAAANMSLGGGSSTAPCDSDPTKPIIDNLRSAGIATVVASGNGGNSNGIAAPGCISTAVSVGSTDDGSLGTRTDAVSSFSNSDTFLDLLAPGQWIESSVPGGGFENYAGTSMAAPHVAGAWALLKGKRPTASVDEVLNALASTGVPIRDGRNGVTTPRIQVDAALDALSGGVARDNIAPVITGSTTGTTFNGTAADNGLNDTGVASVSLKPGAFNVTLTVEPFTSGDATVGFALTLVDPTLDGNGTVAATDLTGNESERTINLLGTGGGDDTTPPALSGAIRGAQYEGTASDAGSGIAAIELTEATNLNLDVDGFASGASSVDFTITLQTRGDQGKGFVVATDVAGNTAELWVCSDGCDPPNTGGGDPDTTAPDVAGSIRGNRFEGTASDDGSGIRTVRLGDDAVNLVLTVDPFSAGASSVGFEVRLDNRGEPGSGTVIATDVDGNEGTLFIDSETSTRAGLAASRVEPGTFALGESYPNPFASSTRIDFSLAEDRAVTLTVLDIMGREVARLVDGQRTAGAHSVTWDAVDAQGRAVAAGVYVYHLQAGDYSESKRLVVLRAD